MQMIVSLSDSCDADDGSNGFIWSIGPHRYLPAHTNHSANAISSVRGSSLNVLLSTPIYNK